MITSKAITRGTQCIVNLYYVLYPCSSVNHNSPPIPHSLHRNQTGSIILIALFMMGIFTIGLVTLTHMLSQHRHILNLRFYELQARYLAESGHQLSASVSPNIPTVYSPSTAFNYNRDRLYSIQLDQGTVYLAKDNYNTLYSFGVLKNNYYYLIQQQL